MPRDPDPTPISLRRATLADGPRIEALVREGGGLDRNSAYLYLIMCRDFGETCWVAEGPRGAAGPLLGFVMGYRPPKRPEAAFVWQVAVSPAARGQGLAGRLLDAFVAGAEGASVLEATVTPSNTASRRLFEGFARRHDARLAIEPDLPAELFADGHEREDRFRIGPLRSQP